MPGPAQHERLIQTDVKMVLAPELSLRGGTADVAILQYPAESWESDRQKRSCLPEIATAPLGPRNDKLGSIARSTMPSYHLPACKARRERRYRRNWLVRFCRQPVRIASACRIPIADTAACAATHEKQTKFRKIPLFFYYGVL